MGQKTPSRRKSGLISSPDSKSPEPTVESQIKMDGSSIMGRGRGFYDSRAKKGKGSEMNSIVGGEDASVEKKRGGMDTGSGVVGTAERRIAVHQTMHKTTTTGGHQGEDMVATMATHAPSNDNSNSRIDVGLMQNDESVGSVLQPSAEFVKLASKSSAAAKYPKQLMKIDEKGNVVKGAGEFWTSPEKHLRGLENGVRLDDKDEMLRKRLFLSDASLLSGALKANEDGGVVENVETTKPITKENDPGSFIVNGGTGKCQDAFLAGLNLVLPAIASQNKKKTAASDENNPVIDNKSASGTLSTVAAATATTEKNTREPGTQEPRVPTGKEVASAELKNYKEIHIATYEPVDQDHQLLTEMIAGQQGTQCRSSYTPQDITTQQATSVGTEQAATLRTIVGASSSSSFVQIPKSSAQGAAHLTKAELDQTDASYQEKRKAYEANHEKAQIVIGQAINPNAPLVGQPSTTSMSNANVALFDLPGDVLPEQIITECLNELGLSEEDQIKFNMAPAELKPMADHYYRLNIQNAMANANSSGGIDHVNTPTFGNLATNTPSLPGHVSATQKDMTSPGAPIFTDRPTPDRNQQTIPNMQSRIDSLMASIRKANYNTAQAKSKAKVSNQTPLEEVPLPTSQSRAQVHAAWDRVVKSHTEGLGANAPVYAPSVEALDIACQDLFKVLDSEMEVWTSKELRDDFTGRVIRVTSRLWKEVTVWLHAGQYTNSCGLALMLQAVIYLLKDVPGWGERVPLFRAFDVFFAEEWIVRRDFGEMAELGDEVMGEETGFARAALLRDSVRTILEMKQVEGEVVEEEAEGMEYIVPEYLTPEGKKNFKSRGKGKEAKGFVVKKPKADGRGKVKTRVYAGPAGISPISHNTQPAFCTVPTQNVEFKTQVHPNTPPSTSEEFCRDNSFGSAGGLNPVVNLYTVSAHEIKQIQESLTLLAKTTMDIQCALFGYLPKDPIRSNAVAILNAKAKETGLLLMNSYLGEWMSDSRIQLTKLADRMTLVEAEILGKNEVGLRQLLHRIERRNISSQIAAVSAETMAKQCLAAVRSLEKGIEGPALGVLKEENEVLRKKIRALTKELAKMRVEATSELEKGDEKRQSRGSLEVGLMQIIWPQGGYDGGIVGGGVEESSAKKLRDAGAKHNEPIKRGKAIDAPITINEGGRGGGGGSCDMM